MQYEDPREEAELLQWLRREEAAPFEGWDFSYLEGRLTEEPLPWDYRQIVSEALPGAASLLDMGTGGGELLSGLSPLPLRTAATEAYPPNVPVARARLEPLGVAVYAIEEYAALPFDDGAFDLVINRHEWYDPAEVYRVLRQGGRFITQQVGDQNDLELNRLLAAPLPDDGGSEWDLAVARAQLDAAGFEVTDAREAFPMSWFHDIGAVVYYLKVIPWQTPDYSLDRYFPRLAELHRRIQSSGPLPVATHRFLLSAVRPAGESP